MPNLNKKGVSEVIGVVFLIFITIVSITIIYSSIKTIALAPEEVISCLELQTKPPIKINSACINQGSEKLEIEIERAITSRAEINSIGFKILSSSENLDFTCGLSCGGCEIPEIKKTYYFSLSDLPDPNSVVVSVNNCALESEDTISSC